MNQDRFKFRAWAKEAEVMHPIWNKLDDEDGEYILMQSTGLKDKNGKLIYEGDIVEFPNHIPDMGKEIAEVEWFDDWGVGFSPFAICGKCGELSAEPDETKVIGNIYENPELVK